MNRVVLRTTVLCVAVLAGLGILILLDGFVAGGPELVVGDAEVLEGDAGMTWLQFPVKLAAPTRKSVTVRYATDLGFKPDGGKPGVDYEATSGWLRFAPGETEKFVAIHVYPNTKPEGHRTLVLNLSLARYAMIADPQGEGVILNDDGADVWVDDAEVAENDGLVEIPLLMDSRISSPIAVEYSTRPVSAAADVDYRQTKGMVTFHPNGPTELKIAVPIIPDSDIEENETFEIEFTASPNAGIAANEEIGKQVITVTILNDDGPTVSIEDGEPVERSPTVAAKGAFTVRISEPLDRDLVVEYELVPGKVSYWGPRPTPMDVTPAVIGEDVVVEGDGRLIIPAGQTTGQIVFNVPPKRSPKGEVVFRAVLREVHFRETDSSGTKRPTIR